eukprot:883232-Pyramimonas_sp.AAC.1
MVTVMEAVMRITVMLGGDDVTVDVDDGVCIMVAMVLMMGVMNVEAIGNDDEDGDGDGDEMARVWDDDADHDDSTITGDDIIIHEWVMGACGCVNESEFEWLILLASDGHDGIVTC